MRHGTLSGHDGEWLAVRAGAVGRAAALGATETALRVAAQIDAELVREEAIFTAAYDTEGPTQTARTLRIATTIAHNLGDLSRVVAEWPNGSSLDVLAPLRERWMRLGCARRPSLRGGRMSQQGDHGRREPSLPASP